MESWLLRYGEGPGPPIPHTRRPPGAHLCLVDHQAVVRVHVGVLRELGRRHGGGSVVARGGERVAAEGISTSVLVIQPSGHRSLRSARPIGEGARKKRGLRHAAARGESQYVSSRGHWRVAGRLQESTRSIDRSRHAKKKNRPRPPPSAACICPLDHPVALTRGPFFTPTAPARDGVGRPHSTPSLSPPNAMAVTSRSPVRRGTGRTPRGHLGQPAHVRACGRTGVLHLQGASPWPPAPPTAIEKEDGGSKHRRTGGGAVVVRCSEVLACARAARPRRRTASAHATPISHHVPREAWRGGAGAGSPLRASPAAHVCGRAFWVRAPSHPTLRGKLPPRAAGRAPLFWLGERCYAA